MLSTLLPLLRRSRPTRFASPRTLSLLAALLTAHWLWAAAVQAQTPVTLNFVDADIDVVAKAVGELTGKTFVLDPKVKGKVNIQSAKGIAPGLAYPTFLSALRMAGYAAVEGAGGIVRVVPEVDAKALPAPLSGASGGSVATKVIPLAHQNATQVVNAVRPLVAAANALTVYPPANAIIITDYADNIRRVEAVISRLDAPTIAAPELVALNHANALDVAATLSRAFADTAGAAEARDRLVITPDARANAVIVRSEDPGRVARVKAMISELDRPTAAPGNIRIIYLKHADASQVAATLRRVLGAEGSTPSTAATTSAPSALSSLLPTATAAAQSPLAAATAALTGASGASGIPGSASAGGGSLPQLSSNSAAAFTAGGATVYADTAINALVISAATPVYNNLRSVIEQLDVRRAQVFVEALIAEVQADRAAEFGIQWQALDGIGRSGTQGFGGTNFGSTTSSTTSNILGVAANAAAAAQGLNVGLIRGTVTIGGKQIMNLGLLARALQSDVQANILSMPTLLALDNEEARFSGGQTVPVLTGQYANSTGANNSVTPFATFDRKDVGLILRVKPLVTEGGAIRLQLYQEVSSVVPSAQSGVDAAGLSTFNKRVLETSVLADDGQIVVLGGLLQEGFTNDQEKVPVLGDAPLLGNLFRYDTRKRTKTNLMIFLRPTVLRSAAQAGVLANERYRILGLDQQSVSPEPRPMLPDMSNPGLPLGPTVPVPAAK
ncbi:MAG: type II secretion system secretin GspD [Burkholderiales bacterium]|nr:type II secretion system secretin GspD [Burkholderiales bacterium]